jgi:IclR family transcriptional regulator, KDG regulon repressor
MDTQKYDSNNITMVDRAVSIIHEIFSSSEPIGVSDIAHNLDLPKATVFRILNTLHQRNVIEKDEESDKYKLGLLFIEYGEKVKSKLNLKAISQPLMKKLSQEVGETINLGIYHEGRVLNIHSEEGESSALVSKLIPVSPLHCSSMGKIFLSQMEDSDIKGYFESNKAVKRTINTILQYEDFIKERQQFIERQLSFDREEYEYGLSCIACPIKDKDNKTIAALSVSGPTSRLKYKGFDSITDSLKSVCDEISQQVKKIRL